MGAVPGEHPLEQADLEAFFDGIFPLQLERSDIAGATVLVIKGTGMSSAFAKGYGYADVKSKKAVDPDTNDFPPRVDFKAFHLGFIMQLEEQGKLNLDTDVNQYLDFQIRPAFNKPVTLRNLMTYRRVRGND